MVLPEFAAAELPDSCHPQPTLVVAAGIHGAEEPAVAVAKTVRRVPNVVSMIASVRSVIEGTRWPAGDANMSGQIPGNPRSPFYNGQRAFMVSERLHRYRESTALEMHSSVDNTDFGWVLPGVTREGEIAKLVGLGVRNVVLAERRFNLFGHFPNTVCIDIGTKSPFLNPNYCGDIFRWLATEYDPQFDVLTDPLNASLETIPIINFYSHAGWVPHAERKRVRLPKNMDTLEPIDPDKAHALGLPPGAMAVSWREHLPMAGEVFVPYKYTRKLEGLLSVLVGKAGLERDFQLL